MNTKNIAIIAGTLLAGILLGWLIFSGSPDTAHDGHGHTLETAADETIWTCSMHPQIRREEPGDCPICNMELIPLEEEGGDAEAVQISMSPTAMQLANIHTQVVGTGRPEKKVRLNGKVQEDERLLFSQSSHIPGRIESLAVNFTGQYVSAGTTLAQIYSPDLVTTQNELLQAYQFRESRPQLYLAARQKLQNWKLTEAQIDAIIEAGEPRESFPVQAGTSGYVTEKMVNIGDYVNRGQTIYQIANLNRVWVLFDVYESDLAWVEKGDEVSFSVASMPGKTFEGTISYIDPVINSQTRVAKARVVVNNSEKGLKPEMFVSGVVEASLPAASDALIVPKSAIMWTGTRSIAYVKKETDAGVAFEMREVVLGPALGDGYVVESGLNPGDEIAVNGTFSIDAAAQLAGKPSMMNMVEGTTGNAHEHGLMQSPDEATFRVSGLCSMCKDRIEKTALALEGVGHATWSQETGMLHVKYDEDVTSLMTIHRAIAQAGHDTEKVKAPDAVYEDLPGCCKYTREGEEEASVQEETFRVSGMCGMCKDRIEETAMDIEGVTFANWEQESNMTTVKFDPEETNLMEIHEAIAAVGHDTEKVKATDEAYEELHTCCKYPRD